MKPNLFDDSPDDVDELSKIEVNKEFAVRYEHNKNREDLQKLEELKKKGLVSDSSSESDSDSDYGVKSTKEDIELFDALLKVRNKDPVLKEKDSKLFDSPSDSESGDEDDGGEDEKKKEKKAGKKYLKDVNAEHLLEFGAEFGAREDEDEEEEGVKKVKTYSDEQEELRKAFLDAVAEADGEAEDDGDFLRLKSKEGVEEDEEEEDGVEIKERLNKFFGEDDKLDENELFLKKFFENRMWIDKDKGKTPGIDEDIELSEDEEEIERQEDYEREFNFRFEENAGDRVQSHSRVAMDSVRKTDNPRKEQRKRKKERMEQAELERREEVKRLKNLKKKEIMEKLNKIRQIAGLDDGVDIPLTEADLEEDFDPEKYDRQMKSAFGEEYYDAEDADSDFVRDGDEGDLEKPDFEKEDKLLGLPEDWDVCKPGEGFLSEREKYLETLEEEEGESGEGEEEVEDEVEEPSEGKRKRKKKMSLREKVALDKDLEELYKLDYEDTIGDLKTRFKYKPVVPKRYGLSADELLTVDEKELNQVISIKKLAPYREKEWTVPHTKLMDLKRKSREQQTNEKRFGKDESRKHKKRKTDERVKGSEKEKEKEKQTTDDSVAMSRKEKRKHRKSELKISESRLMAYGKIPSKSKNK